MKRTAPAAVAAIMAMSAMAPAAAHAEVVQETEVQSPDAVRMVWHYTTEDPAPAPAGTIQQDGSSWKMVSGEDAEDGGYTPRSASYSRTAAKDLGAAEAASPESSFDAAMAIEDGEFQGSIPLSGVSVQPIYRNMKGQVDKTYTIPAGLASNDAQTLYDKGYGSMAFETRSDAAPGAVQTQTLELANVSFKPCAYDAYGIPSEWGAVLTYRGQESWLDVDHYQAVATYSGDVKSIVSGRVSTAEYRRDAPEPEPAAQEPEPSPEEPPFDLTPIGAGAAASAAVAAAAFWGTRRVRVCAIGENGGVEIIERIKPIADGAGDLLAVSAPVDFNARTYFLDIPARFSRRNRAVTVTAGGITVFRGNWDKRIYLNGTEAADTADTEGEQ